MKSCPTEPKKKELFDDCTFLLTMGARPDPSQARMDPESTDDSDDTTTEEEPEGSKFSRSEVRKAILDNGGRLLDAFPGQDKLIPASLILGN